MTIGRGKYGRGSVPGGGGAGAGDFLAGIAGTPSGGPGASPPSGRDEGRSGVSVDASRCPLAPTDSVTEMSAALACATTLAASAACACSSTTTPSQHLSSNGFRQRNFHSIGKSFCWHGSVTSIKSSASSRCGCHLITVPGVRACTVRTYAENRRQVTRAWALAANAASRSRAEFMRKRACRRRGRKDARRVRQLPSRRLQPVLHLQRLQPFQLRPLRLAQQLRLQLRQSVQLLPQRIELCPLFRRQRGNSRRRPPVRCSSRGGGGGRPGRVVAKGGGDDGRGHALHGVANSLLVLAGHAPDFGRHCWRRR